LSSTIHNCLQRHKNMLKCIHPWKTNMRLTNSIRQAERI
jgi:hypothetical protein